MSRSRSRRRITYGGILAVLTASSATLGAWSAATNSATAQEAAPAHEAAPEPNADAAAATARFHELEAEWKTLMSSLLEMQKIYPSTRGRQRASIVRNYGIAITTRGIELEQAMLVAAREAYAAAPNQDAEIGEFLFAVVTEAVDSKQLVGVPEVAAVLAEGGYDSPEIVSLAAQTAFWADQWDDAERFFRLAVERGELDEASADDYLVEIALRREEAERDDLPQIKLKTNYGEIVIELFEDQAPNTVANFISLAESGFYNEKIFHRVEKQTNGSLEVSLLQGGCPVGDGTGGPPYTIACECVREDHRNHFRGSVSMARTEDLDSAGSQFFICRSPLSHLDGAYAVFGRVISGMPIADAMPIRNPKSPTNLPTLKITTAEVLRKRDHDYLVETLPLPANMLRPQQ